MGIACCGFGRGDAKGKLNGSQGRGGGGSRWVEFERRRRQRTQACVALDVVLSGRGRELVFLVRGRFFFFLGLPGIRDYYYCYDGSGGGGGGVIFGRYYSFSGECSLLCRSPEEEGLAGGGFARHLNLPPLFFVKAVVLSWTLSGACLRSIHRLRTEDENWKMNNGERNTWRFVADHSSLLLI